MAYGSLAQTIWSARLDANLQKTLVYGALANRNYEGDAANANIVAINTLGSVTTHPYNPTGSMPLDDISSTSQSLNLNQKYTFNVMIQDFTKVQSRVDLANGLMQEAAYAIGDRIDQFMAALPASASYIENNVTSSDAASSAGTITIQQTVGNVAQFESSSMPASHSAASALARLGEILDKQNVPKQGRWVVVPAWFNALLNQDSKWNFQPSILANGLVQGQLVSGLQVYVSNNTPGTYATDNTIIASHPVCWTYASAIQSIEAYRPQGYFADAIKGLYVYGGLVTKPAGFAFIRAVKK